MQEKGTKKAAFLSRGGYFLKVVFDLFQKKKGGNISTIYLKNSRKVNDLAQRDCKMAKIMKKYFEEKGLDNPMCIVDEGWYCSSQICFSELFGWETDGYYLGVMGRPEAPRNCYRKGLLFDIGVDGIKSPFFGIFRANCTFYEQILTAPHGSLVEYIYHEGCAVETVEKNISEEQELYNQQTKYLQDRMLSVIENMITINTHIDLYWLAKANLKTLLFANKEHLEMLATYNRHYYNNFTNDKKKGISAYSFCITDMIVHPLDYVRFFCKVKEVKSDKKVVRILYKPIGVFIYLICCFALWIEKRGVNYENIS